LTKISIYGGGRRHRVDKGTEIATAKGGNARGRWSIYHVLASAK